MSARAICCQTPYKSMHTFIDQSTAIRAYHAGPADSKPPPDSLKSFVLNILPKTLHLQLYHAPVHLEGAYLHNSYIRLTCNNKLGQYMSIYFAIAPPSGVNSDPADPAMRGGGPAGLGGPKFLVRIFLHNSLHAP